MFFRPLDYHGVRGLEEFNCIILEIRGIDSVDDEEPPERFGSSGIIVCPGEMVKDCLGNANRSSTSSKKGGKR